MSSHLLLSFFSLVFLHSGTVISVLEKLLSQSAEQDNPSRLVIEAAHGSASKVRELVQKYPDKVSATVLPFAAVCCLLMAAQFTRTAAGKGWEGRKLGGDVPFLNTLSFMECFRD